MSGVKREKLLRPNPGVDEYRIYWNEHEIEIDDNSQRLDEESQTSKIKVLTANYVSAESEVDPTIDDWKQLLTDSGYPEDKINEILG